MAYCDGLIDILSAYFNVSGRQIRSPKRHNLDVARVRQIGMYVANVVLGINMTMIGQGFGRNKSTVIHACHLIEDMRDDDEFDRLVAKLEAITHAALHNKVKVKIDWVQSEDLEKLDQAQIAKRLGKTAAIIIPGGFGERGIQGKINAIQYARQSKTPLLEPILNLVVKFIAFSSNSGIYSFV